MAKILAFSDIHTEYGYYDYLSPKIIGIMQERLRTVSPDFVITLGDIKKETLKFIAKQAKHCNIPVMSVRGNHDLYELSGIPNVTDMHRKVIEVPGKTRRIRLAGVEGCLKYGKEERHPAGYDDTNARIVFAKEYYRKEKDYSWVVENFLSEDGNFIGELPIGIDLAMFHCAPVGGRNRAPYQSPPSLAKLVLTRGIGTVVHGHLHENKEKIFERDKRPVRVISVCTISPFDGFHAAGELIELRKNLQNDSTELNKEKAIK